ncbi:MAG: type pilus assembly protein PilM [Pelosinus sp.]|jgi:type IV pilus assembly protein PilM|nr:type pilus assembly protein PilM [Pelosinus sp.]
MWKKIQHFLLKKNSNVIGVDIGTGAIKIVEIHWKKDRPVLKNLGIKLLPPKTIEDGRIINMGLLTDILGQLLATTQTSSKHAILAVGGRGMFARELVFPVMTKEELQEAIKWDLEKYIPYAPNSYYFDFSIMSKGDLETEIKVLLVAAPHELINNITSIVKSVGLIPIAIDIEPLALFRTFTDSENAMLIDIGELLSQVTVFQKGNPVIIRNIPLGGQRMTEVIMQAQNIPFHEAEQLKQSQIDLFSLDVSGKNDETKKQLRLLLAEFTRDIRRTAEYYQQQNENVVIEKIYITGGGSKMKNLIPFLSTQLDLPVILHDPLAKLEIPASFDKTHLQKVAPQFATSIGLSLRGGEE